MATNTRPARLTPDGKPDPSIFSTEQNREGIQVGTAIATLIRQFSHSPAAAVEFRQVWGARPSGKSCSTQNTGSGATIVMPGRGFAAERDYTAKERDALEAEGKTLKLSAGEVFALLGARTLDVHLNADAFWTNVPKNLGLYIGRLSGDKKMAQLSRAIGIGPRVKT